MELQKLTHCFSICKLKDFSEVDIQAEYCFTAKTDEEISLVCITEQVPSNTIEREDGWRAFRIQGVLDFSLIGILSQISTLLAQHRIGIFVVSTYNTDYVLTKSENFEKALDVLGGAGYRISG